jgi:6-pyruvoyl-tetrahydropterin synthase
MMGTCVARHFSFCASHRLFLCVDKNHPCSHLHGHNYEGEVIVSARRAYDGMFIDFSTLKERISNLEQTFDHCTIVNESDPFVKVLTEYKMKKVVLRHGDPTVEHMTTVWAEMLTRQILYYFMNVNRLDRIADLKSVTVKMDETRNCWGSYEHVIEDLVLIQPNKYSDSQIKASICTINSRSEFST